MNKKKSQNETEQIKLECEKLKNEVNNKNYQLTSYALLISHKNDIMKKIKNKLTHFVTESRYENMERELNILINDIEKEFKIEKDWKRFEQHFNQTNKDFIIRLKEKYPGLRSTYIKLCIYLKINYSSKEIASLMNISLRGVEKARSRLRKELGLKKTDDLSLFISNI